MKFYLRVINPVLALVVFLLCFWAASNSDESFNIFGIVIGGMSTYFFAKGIFTSLSLLILGRILLEMLYRSDTSKTPSLKRNEILYSVSFGVFTVGSLIGLLLLENAGQVNKDGKVIENPDELSVTDIHRVTEARWLKFSGRIVNSKETEWKEIEIIGKLYINGNLSDKKSHSIPLIEKNEADDFLFSFDEFENGSLTDSIRLDCQVMAIKNIKMRKSGRKIRLW